MAYRPPSTSRFANFTAPPPPSPWEPRQSQKRGTRDVGDGWQEQNSRRRAYEYSPVPVPAIQKPEPIKKPFEEEFPTLGGSSIQSRTDSPQKPMSKSSSNSSLSMADRMKKRLEEEEEVRKAKELQKLRDDEAREKERFDQEFFSSNIITSKNILRRFQDSNRYDEFQEDNEDDLECDAYGFHRGHGAEEFQHQDYGTDAYDRESDYTAGDEEF